MSNMKFANISAAIVTHNSSETIEAVINSLIENGLSEKQITVYDVASSDDTIEKIHKSYKFIRVESLKRNIGPNEARNRSILECLSEFLLLLDGDVELTPNSIERLSGAFRHSDNVGAAIPVVVYKGNEKVIQYSNVNLHFICEAINEFAEKELYERGDKTLEVGVATGNAILMKKEPAIRSGMFDERYFIGKEDGDFSYRMNLSGWKILETPMAIAIHRKESRGDKYYAYQIRNRWHMVLKDYQLLSLIVLFPAAMTYELLLFGMMLFSGNIKYYFWGLKGLLSFLVDLPKDRAAINGIRKVPDWKLLKCGPIVVPEKYLKIKIIYCLKKFYDGILCLYWRFAKKLLKLSSF